MGGLFEQIKESIFEQILLHLDRLKDSTAEKVSPTICILMPISGNLLRASNFHQKRKALFPKRLGFVKLMCEV